MTSAAPILHVGINPGFGHFDLVPEVERYGFDSIWVSEHILFHGPVFEALTMLSFYAAQAPKLTLGTAVYLMPLRHPTITAKTAGTLDLLSNGRLILGIGVGGEYVKEFEACAIPIKQRGGRTDEGIAVVKKLWSEDHVSYSGRYYQLNDVTMEPKPARKGGPPIWVAGRSDAAITRAAKLGDGYLPYLFTTERYKSSLSKVREIAFAAGRNPADVAAGHYLFFCIADSKDEARKIAGDQLTLQYNQAFHNLIDRFVAFGTAEECAETIQKFVDGGARNIILIPATPKSMVDDQVRRAGEELLPLMKRMS